jgi:hypothetical protein
MSSKYTCKYGTTDYLTARNYHTWKRDLSAFLEGEDALEIVLGNEHPPAANATAQFRDYRRRSGRAYALIYSSDARVRSFIEDLDDRNPATSAVSIPAR